MAEQAQAQAQFEAVGANGMQEDVNFAELALNHMLDEYAVLASGGTPETIRAVIVDHLDELTPEAARELLAVALLSTITQRVNVDAFLTKHPGIISFIQKYFWIGHTFNFSNINLMGHMFLCAFPENFRDKYLINAREKIGGQNIWSAGGRYAKVSETQARIFDERRRRHVYDDAQRNGVITAAHLLYKIGFHPVAINHVFGVIVFNSNVVPPPNVIPATVPVAAPVAQEAADPVNTMVGKDNTPFENFITISIFNLIPVDCLFSKFKFVKIDCPERLTSASVVRTRSGNVLQLVGRSRSRSRERLGDEGDTSMHTEDSDNESDSSKRARLEESVD